MHSPTSLPKYVQIAEMLIREIAAGRLVEGQRLPPERDMARELGVAMGTLRKALDALDEKGLLDRVQGSGNYIKSGKEAVGLYALFRLELVSGGGLPTAEVISVDALEKPADLPTFGRSGTGFRIRRLRRLGGQPAALEEIWLDGGSASKLRPEELSESLYHYYRVRLGFSIVRAEDRVAISPAPDWAQPPFGPAPGTHCGFVTRIAWDEHGASPEFSRTWFDTDVARYVARLR